MADFLAAQEATAQLALEKLPTLSASLPTQDTLGVTMRQAPQRTARYGFDKVLAGIDTAEFTLLQTGTGQAINQTGGNLVMTSGTTANSETVARSIANFKGSMTLRYSTTLSQRIANNNFVIELVDVIGDGLAYTISSATVVVVTIPSNPFTSQNVGQGMYLGVITGAAGVPMRAVIASVSGNDVTYTVAGWPASGSGTLSVFGWNYHHIIYTGTTATNASYDNSRNGWASGETTATINTTASGHVGTLGISDGKSAFLDQLSASATTVELSQRASRVRNVPDDGVPLYLQIRSLNGTTNPATTTTWTVGFVSIDEYVIQQSSINNVSPQSANYLLGVQVLNTPAVTGTVTASNVTGIAAHDAVISGNPVRIAGRALTANYTAVATGDVADFVTTTVGAQITKPYSIPNLDWAYAAASGGITNTSDVVLIAAGAAGIRNYLTGISIQNASATIATEVVVKDGATIIWRGYVGTSALLNSAVGVTFPTPLKTTAATALNVACITTGSAVYVNAQGYQAP